jgi:hypothetical protein
MLLAADPHRHTQTYTDISSYYLKSVYYVLFTTSAVSLIAPPPKRLWRTREGGWRDKEAQRERRDAIKKPLVDQ